MNIQSFLIICISVYLSFAPSSFASSDSYEKKLLAHEPDETFNQMSYKIGTAYLHPSNDTMINLSLILQDQGRMTKPSHPTPSFEDDLAPFEIIPYMAEENSSEASLEGVVQDQLKNLKIPDANFLEAKNRLNNWREGRCVSDSWRSLHQFVKQLELAGLPEADIYALTVARLKLAGTCPNSKPITIDAELSHPIAHEFALYLTAAMHFYGGRLNEAGETFKILTESKNPWLQETAYYLIGRVHLNLAQQGAIDSWGLFAKDAINYSQLNNASQAFSSYLNRYATGIYAASTAGLARKIAWLGQNHTELSSVYGPSFKEALMAAPSEAAYSLIFEIDHRYWFFYNGHENISPIFTREPNWRVPEFAAVEVLARQRSLAVDSKEGAKPAYAISAEAIKARLPEFKKNGQEKLGQYLLLSHLFFVEKNYTAVIESTKNNEITQNLSNVDFSILYLRGLALEKLKQNAKAYALWKGLASTVKKESARIQSQIALIIHLAENEQLQEAFNEYSLITYSPIRKPAIVYSADAQVLEYIVQAQHTTTEEKRAALSQLIRKNLLHQQYAEAYRIIKRFPPENFGLGERYKYDHFEKSSPVQLSENLQLHLKNPNDFIQQVNLAIRYINDHMGDSMQEQLASGQVGGFEAKWAGEKKSPLQIFQQVINEPNASEDAKSKALSGAINCFRRVGYNRCDTQKIPLAQRKAWFETLKKTYRKSEWATAQKLYW